MTVEDFLPAETYQDRPARLAGKHWSHDFVSERLALSAESAPDSGDDDPNAAGRKLQHLGQLTMQVVGSLRRGPDRDTSGWIVPGQYCMVFHGDVRVSLKPELILPDIVRRGESLGKVAKFQFDRFVQVAPFGLVMYERAVRVESFTDGHHRRERFVHDVNEITGFLRGPLVQGRHGGNRFPHITYLVNGKRGLVLAGGKNAIFDGEFRPSYHCENPGKSLRPAAVYVQDTGVGIGTA